MRCILLLVIALVLGIAGQGQSPPGPVINSDKQLDKNCLYRLKYSPDERLKIYPFSVSDTVRLVSFRYHKNNYPMREDKVVADSLIEDVILTKAQINQLTDVLYNNITKNQGKPNAVHIGSVNQCYEPRNAILFIGKTCKISVYVLLCFHCRRFESIPEKATWDWDFCDQKFELIRQFFISTGIKYGTDLAVDEFPGE
jgi:hypothetical protein